VCRAQENISNFLKACRGVGMKEFEMFNTNDLFDEKDIPQVPAPDVLCRACLRSVHARVRVRVREHSSAVAIAQRLCVLSRQVTMMIHALGRTIQTTVPEFDGPKLGVRVVDKNVRDALALHC
jgi:hypothetical protein